MKVRVQLEKEGRKTRNVDVWVIDDYRNDVLYKATHINHPSAIWVRDSVENYIWAAEYLLALGDEYTKRYEKRHASIEKLGYLLQSPPLNLTNWDFTKPPSVMDERYIVSDDPVLNYRHLYNTGKSHLLKWKGREKPDWIEVV